MYDDNDDDEEEDDNAHDDNGISKMLVYDYSTLFLNIGTHH